MIEKCPVCNGDMEHPEIKEVGVTIDVCSSCGGVWLDSGELEQIVGVYEQGRKLLRRDPLRAAIKARRIAKSGREAVRRKS